MKIAWGKDWQFTGPRDWYRNTLILDEVRRYKKSGKVIDFGCGNGNLLIRFARRGYKGLGIDTSKDSVRILRWNIKKLRLGSMLSVIKCDEFCFQNGKVARGFDVAIAGESLEHVKDPGFVVKGFYSVLKRNGLCVVSVPAHMWLWNKSDIYAGHYKRFEQNDLRKLFEDNGFRVRKIYYWGFPLGLLWDLLILYPLFRNKAARNVNYTNSKGFLGWVIKMEKLKELFAKVFAFDAAFNWTNLGIGLILIAEK